MSARRSHLVNAVPDGAHSNLKTRRPAPPRPPDRSHHRHRVTALTTGRYVLGFAILTVTVTSVAWSGVQVRRFAFPTWTGAIARLAEVVVAISEVVAVTEALGAIGLFRRVAVLATTLAFAAAIGMSARRRIPRRLAPSRNSADRAREPSSADRAVLAIACAVVAVVVCQWGAVTVHALRQGMGLDSNWYHMPFAAQAVQHGWGNSGWRREPEGEHEAMERQADAARMHGSVPVEGKQRGVVVKPDAIASAIHSVVTAVRTRRPLVAIGVAESRR